MKQYTSEEIKAIVIDGNMSERKVFNVGDGDWQVRDASDCICADFLDEKDAKAIELAFNNTFLKGVNPQAVEKMYQALRIIADGDPISVGLDEIKELCKTALEDATISEL